MTRAPLTAATARAVIVDVCQLAANKPVTSVIICDPRAAAQHSLSQMLRPLHSLIRIACVPDGFALVDTYSAQAADIVLIGIERSIDTGPEAVALQSAMHPQSVIITVGAATDADLLVAVTIAGAQGLLVWDHNQLPTGGDPQPGGPLAW
jgi:AmiR/NasT family two-component response regulator